MWYMNEEREMIKNMVAEFAENEVRPFVLNEMEKNDTFPMPLIKRAGELGILGLCYPEEIGGQGVDWVNMGIALEEISKVSTCVGLLVRMASAGSYPLYLNKTPMLLEKMIKPMIQGELVVSAAMCEPAGSISVAPFWSTKAVPDGDEFVINGSKIFCTLAGQCEYYGVMALTGEFNPKTKEGVTFFLIHKDNPGLKVGHIEHKMGWHGSSTGTIYLDNCRVSKDSTIGGIGTGLHAFGSSSMITNAAFAVLSLGGAEGAYEKALKYCKERMHGNASLFDRYQAVRHRLVNMKTKIDACRAMVYENFEMLNRGIDCSAQCVEAKIYAQQVFEEVAGEAVLLHGGNGLMVGNYDVERYYRDSKMLAIGGFSVDVLRDNVSAML